jgi:hypothetical protein
MIKKFSQYNESIKDKMTPIELSGVAKMIYNAAKDVESLGYKVNGLKNNQGRYEFSFIDENETDNNRYVTVIYQDKEESKKIYTDEALKNMVFGWIISIYEGFTRSYSMENVNTETWEQALLDIVYGLYPNIDDTINETNKIIKKKEKLLTNLQKMKNILNA